MRIWGCWFEHWRHLVTSWEEGVHGEVGEPVQLLEALVDSNLGCEMGVGELVHLHISQLSQLTKDISVLPYWIQFEEMYLIKDII